MRCTIFFLERAPAPISGRASRQWRLGTAHDRRLNRLAHFDAGRRRVRHRPRSAGTMTARRGRGAKFFPSAILVPAVPARPGLGPGRMKLGVLVERNGIVGMAVAKDVAAMPTVMSPFKERKGPRAHGRITDGGLSVGLPMDPGRYPLDSRKVIRPERLRRRLRSRQSGVLAVTRRPSARRLGRHPALQAVGTAVNAPGRSQGCRAMRTFCWSQDRRDIHGRLGWPQLTCCKREVRRHHSGSPGVGR